ncbi:hypothetical protein R1sor_025993 [Riccia sorocarpa]|uniref:Uncharacterized protein n=1 Tax=Riccia sorocarpa TaxID=122646 RepID=A0ABD3GDF3_9MARC
MCCNCGSAFQLEQQSKEMTRLKEEQSTQSKRQEEETSSLKEEAALIKDQLYPLVRDRYAAEGTGENELEEGVEGLSGEELFQLLRGGGVEERGLVGLGRLHVLQESNGSLLSS